METMCYLLWTWARWLVMQWVCSSLYQRYKEEGSIKPIPTEDADPLEVFKECNTAVNLKRFIPFVIWLKDRPRSFHWFQTIERDFPHLVPCLSTLLRMRFLRQGQ